MTLSAVPSGAGTVSAIPSSSRGCAEGAFIDGEQMQLTAIPIGNCFQFISWSGSSYTSSVSKNASFLMPSTATVLSASFGPPTASTVWGKSGSFLFNGVTVTGSTSLAFPLDVSLDNGGGIYIADQGNNRVLFYPAGSVDASRVYGQSGNTAPTQSTAAEWPLG
jgi:hypothetical protein